LALASNLNELFYLVETYTILMTLTDSMTNDDCLFCKIVSEKIPSKKVYSDDQIFAFHDIQPVAPIHILIVPKRHIATLNDLTADDAELIGQLLITGKNLAKQLGIAGGGYRINLNCNADGGQTVFHIHAHLLGGKAMGWPPFPN
jgi:histidine triad (HIT) family protein